MTNKAPVGIFQSRVAIEPEMQTTDKVAQDQSHDTQVVEMQPAVRYTGRMVQERVVQRRHSQADRRRQQLEREHRPIEAGEIRVPRPDMFVHEALSEDRNHRRDQMRIDVARFVVQVCPARQRAKEGVALIAIARNDKWIHVVPLGDFIYLE